MNQSRGSMVHQVRQSTDSIATASAEIASGNNDLAQRNAQNRPQASCSQPPPAWIN